MRQADVPFLLGGGLAAWARGGPESDHDLDLMVKPEDAEPAVKALEAAGFRMGESARRVALQSLRAGDVLVDIIFEPSGGPVDDEMFERAEELDVNAVTMLVMSLEDVMTTKLLSLREHEVDYESVLEIGRALREQIDWDEVWRRTSDSPYARAFFYLAEQVGILAEKRASPSESDSSRVPSGSARES